MLWESPATDADASSPEGWVRSFGLIARIEPLVSVSLSSTCSLLVVPARTVRVSG